MADREMRVRHRMARDIEPNWEKNNPVLLDGEPIIVYDTEADPENVRLKFGDGNTAYKDLPFFGVNRDSVNFVIPLVPEQLGTLVYNGEYQSPVWKNYDVDQFIVTGEVSAKDAGVYTTVFQPAPGYCWADKTGSPQWVRWEIRKKTISVLPTPRPVTYTGAPISAVWENFSPDELTISGEVYGIDAREYSVTFTPTNNCEWSDEIKEGVDS